MEKLTYEQQFVEAAIDVAIEYFNDKYQEEEDERFYDIYTEEGQKKRAKMKQEIIARMMQRQHSQRTDDNVEVVIYVSGVDHSIFHNRYHLGPLRRELICFALEGAMHEFTQDMATILQQSVTKPDNQN